MSLDSIPLWVVLLATIAVVLFAIQSGIRLGKRRQARGGGKLEVSGAMVGATMGLLAFMLAFTFNGAAARHETRKTLVIEEANAIETTWLRAGFLPEQSRTTMRGLLRTYVGVRVNVALGQIELAEGLHQTESLQDRMWAVAVEGVGREPGSIALGLFVQSLNEVIDLHTMRLTVAIRNRVPGTVWVALYALMVIGMIMMGTQIGQAETRHFTFELALAVSFSLVLLMIADLDRPQQGFVRVSQQAMIDLQTKLDGH
jgi:CDP-diglyceride synthetase